ncbi:nucleoid DNA-binding protein [Bradyrhizobium japonicum]|uniref:Nucleoid DNA-binding protein n=1 Tax=Bradyrhizobium japonicum TaxID=375 RepID=A0ABV2S9K3_BRAJP
MTTATEIADEIAKAYNLPKAQAKAIVDGVFKSIADAAAATLKPMCRALASSR